MLFDEINMLVLEGKRDTAVRVARRRPGPVAAVFAVLLTATLADKADLEEVATMQGRKELQRLTRRLPLLHLITGIAPLLGLLGTVLGLMRAFQKVAATQGMVNPNPLAAAIWEVLLTTVVGPMIAIPTAVVHYYLEQKAKAQAFQVNYYGMLLIRLLAVSETEDVHA